MSFTFIDRLGNQENLETYNGETVSALLRRHYIPPSSVLVMSRGAVIVDSHVLESGRDYEARLIEGYDIGEIRSALKASTSGPGGGTLDIRRLIPNPNGKLDVEFSSLDGEALCQHVVDTIVDTFEIYNLINEGDRVLVGLSGGVDSSSLLLALHEARPRLPKFTLVAVTFEDYDSTDSPTFTHANKLAQDLSIEHHIVPAKSVEAAFGLNKPLREILPELMCTKHASMTMYIDHHTTRRGLELFAEANDIGRVALGLHTTDLMAGILNSVATGYTVASLPVRRIGTVDYIYPLAFVSKRALHLYHYYRTGTLVRHSFPNKWERNPLDRNFYYYLADMMQEYWPGMEAFVFSSHNWRLRREQPVRTEVCRNCGSTLVVQPFMSAGEGECEVCQVFKTAGYR